MAVAGHDQCPRELEGATVLPVYTLVSNCVVAFLNRKFFYLSPAFRSMELINAPPELIILGKGGGLHKWCKGANLCNAGHEDEPRSILEEGHTIGQHISEAHKIRFECVANSLATVSQIHASGVMHSRPGQEAFQKTRQDWVRCVRVLGGIRRLRGVSQ